MLPPEEFLNSSSGLAGDVRFFQADRSSWCGPNALRRAPRRSVDERCWLVASRVCSHPVQRTANGSARSRSSEMSSTHSAQFPYVLSANLRSAASILAKVSDFICMTARSISACGSDSELSRSSAHPAPRRSGCVRRASCSTGRSRDRVVGLRAWLSVRPVGDVRRAYVNSTIRAIAYRTPAPSASLKNP